MRRDYSKKCSGIIVQILHHNGGVAKVKEHDHWFKESFVGDESCFPLMAIFDTNIVIPLANVKFDEVASIFQLIHKVGDEREGVGVTGGLLVKVPIILARVKLSILLFDKEERGCLREIGWTDLSSS